jgi:hypothetical protein
MQSSSSKPADIENHRTHEPEHPYLLIQISVISTGAAQPRSEEIRFSTTPLAISCCFSDACQPKTLFSIDP